MHAHRHFGSVEPSVGLPRSRITIVKERAHANGHRPARRCRGSRHRRVGADAGHLEAQPEGPAPGRLVRVIADQAERSRALFNEVAKVVTHPRCMNCHPAGEHPTQGNDQHEHMPPTCAARPASASPGVLLGLPHREELHAGRHRRDATRAFRAIRAGSSRRSRWRGRASRSARSASSSRTRSATAARSLALLHEHFAKDDLVAWGWAPGEGREPAPGTQQQLGELAQAWIDTGAECPSTFWAPGGTGHWGDSAS